MLKQNYWISFEDLNKEISYKQWVSVDRTEFDFSKSKHFGVHKFNNHQNLNPWYLITTLLILNLHTSNFEKKTMEENSALILMDFAKNYAFHVQDETRGITGPITVVRFIQVVCLLQEFG